MIRKFFLLFLFSTSLNYANQNNDLPVPYNEVDLLPFNPHGWYRNSEQIEAIIKNNAIFTVVEVGSWLGASTRHIATLLPPSGKVYAVDHWLGAPEDPLIQKAYSKDLPHAYQQFLSNVIHAKLTDKIIPIRMTSLEAARTLNVNPDMVYIDADHSTAAVTLDLETWYPIVKGHGILCGDDWSWSSVRVAVEKFAKTNGLIIETSGNFWRLIEK